MMIREPPCYPLHTFVCLLGVARKRRGGVVSEGPVRQCKEVEDVARGGVGGEAEEKEEKARIDDLWASFKQEVGSSVQKGKVPPSLMFFIFFLCHIWNFIYYFIYYYDCV